MEKAFSSFHILSLLTQIEIILSNEMNYGNYISSLFNSPNAAGSPFTFSSLLKFCHVFLTPQNKQLMRK